MNRKHLIKPMFFCFIAALVVLALLTSDCTITDTSHQTTKLTGRVIVSGPVNSVTTLITSADLNRINEIVADYYDTHPKSINIKILDSEEYYCKFRNSQACHRSIGCYAGGVAYIPTPITDITWATVLHETTHYYGADDPEAGNITDILLHEF